MTTVPTIPIRPMATLSYKTFLKRIVVQSLRDGFANHPDPTVAATTVSLDYPMNLEKWVGIVIVKFYERDIMNSGVGHVEYLADPATIEGEIPTNWIKYYH